MFISVPEKASVSRIFTQDMESGGKTIIDLTKDAPNAKYLNCNAIADPIKKYLYVAVSDEYYETTISNGNLLVYDCSGETPVLVKNHRKQDKLSCRNFIRCRNSINNG